MFQLLEPLVRKSHIEEVCNFSNGRKGDEPPEYSPPVQLRPDEDEGVHPDVQLPLRVSSVQQPQAVGKADPSFLQLLATLCHVLPMENTLNHFFLGDVKMLCTSP